MKTDDLWFRGFPATWNIVVLYLFVLQPPWVLSALILLGAAALMFTPVVFIHPLRVVRMRGLTIAMTCAWFALAAWIIENLAPQPWSAGPDRDSDRYFLGLPFLRHSPLAQRLSKSCRNG